SGAAPEADSSPAAVPSAVTGGHPRSTPDSPTARAQAWTEAVTWGATQPHQTSQPQHSTQARLVRPAGSIIVTTTETYEIAGIGIRFGGYLVDTVVYYLVAIV